VNCLAKGVGNAPGKISSQQLWGLGYQSNRLGEELRGGAVGCGGSSGERERR
jgi:hypothetical protein